MFPLFFSLSLFFPFSFAGLLPYFPFFSGRFPLNSKSGNFGCNIKWNGPWSNPNPTSNGTERTWSDRNIRDQLWRWSSLTRLVISVGWTEMFLSIWQNCCPACKNNNQARGGLGRVCAPRMYRSIEHVKFQKFQTGIFVEWKVPSVFLFLHLRNLWTLQLI